MKDLNEMSYNEIVAKVKRGKITVEEIEKAYSKNRKTAMGRIKRIASAPNISYRAFGQQKPQFDTLRQVRQNKEDYTRELIKSFVDLSQFMRHKTSTITGRKKQMEKAINTLHSRGVTYVNMKNYGTWVRFTNYLRSTAAATAFYVLSDEAEEAFTDAEEQGQGNNLTKIISLFEEYAGL